MNRNYRQRLWSRIRQRWCTPELDRGQAVDGSANNLLSRAMETKATSVIAAKQENNFHFRSQSLGGHFLWSLSGGSSTCPFLLSGWHFCFGQFEAITAKLLAYYFIVGRSFVLNALAFAFRRLQLRGFHCYYTSQPINQCQSLSGQAAEREYGRGIE